jgi:surface protein
MPVVTVSTLGGGDIVIPFPDDGMPVVTTTGDLIRELATLVPNHRTTFLLHVNDSEHPVDGHARDADLTTVVDTTKDVTLLFQSYEAFDCDVSKWDTSSVTDMEAMFACANAFNGDVSSWDTSRVTIMRDMLVGTTTGVDRHRAEMGVRTGL